MKNSMFLIVFFSSQVAFSQNGAQPLRNLFNEFYVSVNHGISAPRTFFGAGLGASHVFHPDRALGARIGLETDYNHFWNNGVYGPEFNKYQSRKNQHFNAFNVSVPLDLQINFGNSVRYLFEIGAHVGYNVYTRYSAEITNSPMGGPSVNEHLDSNLNLGALFGCNMGIGVRIPFNDGLSFLIKPAVGVQAYSTGFSGSSLTTGNAYAKLTLGILRNN